MDNLSRRHNLVPFFLVLVLGVSISLYLPQYFLTANIEIPAFALISGELAIALIASIFSFENASFSALIKLAIWILIVSALDAVLCFFIQHGSTISLLPAATLKLNWIQLLIFNLTGIGTIFSLYTTISSIVRTSTSQGTMIDNHDLDLWNKRTTNLENDFNDSSIKNLEPSLSKETATYEKISLEALLAEDPTKLSQPISSSTNTDISKEFTSASQPNINGKLLQNVGEDLDSIFSQIAPQEQEFSTSAKKSPTDIHSNLAPPNIKNDLTSSTLNAGTSEVITNMLSTEGVIFGPKITNGNQASTSIKEFGKLSTNTVQIPTGESSGTLKSIGQMLLDTKAIEHIIQQTDGPIANKKWQVISLDKAANMQALMDNISALPGVESALLIGRDGMLLANTENLATQKYILGPLSLAIHNTISMSTLKLQIGQLQQAVLRCSDKVSILTDLGTGILAVFAAWDNNNIDNFLEGILAASNTGAATNKILQDTVITPKKEASLTTMPLKSQPIPVSTTPVKDVLGKVSDADMTNIFDNLASGNSPNEIAPAATSHQGPLNVSASEVSDLFDNLLAESTQDKALFTSPTTKELKEFGKLSSSAASKQDSGIPEGTMKTIGKQLMDVQAVENIIKAGEGFDQTGKGFTKTQVISAAHGEGMQSLLKQISTCQGVVGSVVIGHDGFVQASTLQQQIDKDTIGALSTAMYSHLNAATKTIGKGKLEQAVFLSSDNKMTVFTLLATGVLAVFVDQGSLNQLDNLIKIIETTMHG